MKRISFSWTTDALLAGAKSRTRRHWDDRYALTFREGEYVEAWDKLPYAGGKVVGTVRLICQPYQQSTNEMTEEDYRMEGLLWMEQQGKMIRGLRPRYFFEEWKQANELVWVVCFKWLGIGRAINE